MAGPVTLRPVPPFRSVHAVFSRARMAEQRRNFPEAARLKEAGRIMSQVSSAQLQSRIRSQSVLKSAAPHGAERGGEAL